MQHGVKEDESVYYWEASHEQYINHKEFKFNEQLATTIALQRLALLFSFILGGALLMAC